MKKALSIAAIVFAVSTVALVDAGRAAYLSPAPSTTRHGDNFLPAPSTDRHGDNLLPTPPTERHGDNFAPAPGTDREGDSSTRSQRR